MAFKLTKKEISDREELVSILNEKCDAFEQVQADAVLGNATADDLSTALAAVVVAVSNAETFRDEVATRFRDEYNEKSEKWVESDKGNEVDGFISEWESVSFDEPNLDEPLELELENYAEVLEELPEEFQS